MKEPKCLLGKTGLNSFEMHEAEIQTAAPVYTREATETMVKIFDSSCAKEDIEQVDTNATQINVEERNQPLRLLQYFKYFFMVL